VDCLKFSRAIEGDGKDSLGPAYYFQGTDDLTAAAQNPYYRFLQTARPDGPGFRLILGSIQQRDLEWPRHLGGEKIKHPETGENYRDRSQKEVDVLLAFNLVRSQANEGWRKLYLVAGDKDFYAPVRYLVEDRGVEVTIFGLRANALNLPSIAAKYGPFAKHRYFEEMGESIKADRDA
jgi:uncharacterized LabA/DUF88 family protein